MSKLDNFFQEKAEDFELQPQKVGWQDVNRQLKKKQQPVWIRQSLRIAAAISLLVITYFLGFRYGQNALEQQIASAEPPIPTASDKATGSDRQAEGNVVKEEVSNKPARRQNALPVQSVAKRNPQPLQTKPSTVDAERENLVDRNYVVVLPLQKTQMKTIDVDLRVTVNLLPETAQEPATGNLAQAKKKNEIGQIIQTAKDFEAPEYLADLRDAKDEFFSLDFNAFKKRLKTIN